MLGYIFQVLLSSPGKEFQIFIHQCQGDHASSFLMTAANQKNVEKNVQITMVKQRTTLQELLTHINNMICFTLCVLYSCFPLPVSSPVMKLYQNKCK